MTDPLLQVSHLHVQFGAYAAVRDVSFELFAAETLGLVGESGSGKSTLARAILRLVRAAQGSVGWRGRDLLSCDAKSLRGLRRDLQIVFQDPLASLNPRMTAGETIAEPLKIFEASLGRRARQSRVDEMLERVGLAPAMAGRYPHEFSGGQCQRIGIARAMILGPALLICDEPVSSLDMSVQGQIVNLLLDLQRDTGTAMLFISHNLGVVRHVSHRVLVMYSGAVVEAAARDALFSAPVHPYTRALLAAVPAEIAGLQATPPSPPSMEPRLARLEPPRNFGEPSALEGPPIVDSPIAEPPIAALTGPRSDAYGCAYRDRCAYALAVCSTTVPVLEEIAAGHWVACHRSRELSP